MAIRHSKRPRPSADPGRRQTSTTPTSAATHPNVYLNLIEAGDLPHLASAAGLELAFRGAALRGAAATINGAFSDYANAAGMQAADSPSGQRRDWCIEQAKRATALLRGLGYVEGSGEMGRDAFDALDSLEKGWPADPGTPAEHELREHIKRLFVVAVPDTYVSTEPSSGGPNLDTCWSNLFGRLGPALAATAALAEAAGRAWGAETSRGGSGKDRARRHLMRLLVGVFTKLFGRRPDAAPGSSGFKWFSALIELASRRAGDGCGPPEAEPALVAAEVRSAALEAVEALARHIGPPAYTMATKGTAKLDHWIREALDRGDARPADPAVSASIAARRTRGPKAEKGE